MEEMMKWSKLKKQLEDFICPSLKGRVEFWITSYRKTHDQVGRAYITVDGKEVINMCTLKKEIAIYGEENELMSSDNINLEQNEFDEDKDIIFQLLRKEGFSEDILLRIARNRSIHDIAKREVETKCIFSQYDFIEAAKKFLNSPIQESLKSNNPIIKSLALLDRRVGKRTLNMLKESMKNESELVRYFYNLRCESEGILNC